MSYSQSKVKIILFSSAATPIEDMWCWEINIIWYRSKTDSWSLCELIFISVIYFLQVLVCSKRFWMRASFPRISLWYLICLMTVSFWHIFRSCGTHPMGVPLSAVALACNSLCSTSVEHLKHQLVEHPYLTSWFYGDGTPPQMVPPLYNRCC